MTKPSPTNKKLYEKVSNIVKKKHPKHSAYRSGLIVKAYLKAFKKKYPNKSPYRGSKSKGSLKRWFSEEWKNQRGESGYKSKSDVYRPTKRITKDTPKTFKELGKKRIKRAMKEKRESGRVKKF